MRSALIFLFSMVAFLGLQGVASAGVNTQTANITVYKINLYPNADCTGTAQTILDVSGGQSFDMAASPTLTSSSVTDGTYNCFAMKMSDNVTFTPAADTGTNCVAGTSYTIDVCKPISDGSGGTLTPYYYNPEGGSTPSDAAGYSACTTGNDTVWVFVSTTSTATAGSSGHNAFAPPNSSGSCQYSGDPSPGCGFKLSNAITVSGNTTGTFVFDTDGKVQDSNGACDMEAPNFGYE
ncbi:MAG: hypothetical protein HQK84_02385 [Nitrospinae bacterium]|nr:hypothetical protein [Nitrospinota bacterium]